MKITIDRKIFAQALAEVAPFAPAKAPMAILKNAKITTKGNRMKVEANDTQTSMVKYIETMECDEDGSFLIDIADFNKYIAKTKGDTIEVTVDGYNIKVKHSKGTAEFQTADAKEFPSFNMPQDETTEIRLNSALLADAIQKGRNFVSNDKVRPQMGTIYAYVNDKEFGYCASDTTKLIHGYNECTAEIKTPDGEQKEVNWYIMPSVFNAVANACKENDTAVLHITPTKVQYTIGNVRIQTVLANGKFPAFRRVIPTIWNMECAVEKLDIVDALGRVSMFCDSSECMKMDISRMDMTLSVDNIDYMKSSKENITHAGCSGEIQIGVNASKMMTCMSVFNNGEILMRMTDPARPILLCTKDVENLKVIIMPLALVN